MEELIFELEHYTDDKGAFGATLVVEARFETEQVSGSFWGKPYNDTVKYLDVGEATLFTYNQNGGELQTLENVDATEYITEDEIASELEKYYD